MICNGWGTGVFCVGFGGFVLNGFFKTVFGGAIMCKFCCIKKDGLIGKFRNQQPRPEERGCCSHKVFTFGV